MTTFITRLPSPPGATGPRLAVKDLIDVEGVVTTAGSRAVAETARPAGRDAACMAGARAAGAVIVGKANLHELAYGGAGINEWFGTPVNPLDPALLPGGSSSGSAVAVADGEAEVAYGSDTGGSVRIPSAFCGITGLKTTHGRISLDGVWPLAPSLDTVGPMARDVAGVITGMTLLGFLLLARWIVTSKLGRVLTAIRDAESRVMFSGYNPVYFKLFIWTLSAVICGIAGALYVPQVGIINPSEMSPANSIEIAIWTAVGGRGTLIGPVLGAAAVNLGKSWFTKAFPESWLFALGLLFILVTLFLPRGIAGLWARRRERT